MSIEKMYNVINVELWARNKKKKVRCRLENASKIEPGSGSVHHFAEAKQKNCTRLIAAMAHKKFLWDI